MAYDPEARQQGKTALVVGICALLLLGGGAIAYFSSQPTPAEVAGPTIIRSEKEKVLVQPTPLPQQLPGQVVVVPGPTQAPVVQKETVVRERAVPVPVPAPQSSGGDRSSTNVTVNNVTPPAGNSNAGTANRSTTDGSLDAAASSSAPQGAAGSTGGTSGQDGY